MFWHKYLIGLVLLAVNLAAGPKIRPVPIIDVTDLYHPHQDVGDNVDLIAAYALPEVDLRAVILDITAAFRKPVGNHPGIDADAGGPRDPGFIQVQQLNYIYGRNVPSAVGPFAMMKSPADKMLDAPKSQQQGMELILKTLRESALKVHILSFGSARPIAAAYNRESRMFKQKVARIHLCAGASDPAFLEWNVLLDPQAIVCLLRSDLPVAIYPCANKEGAFGYGTNNCFWKLPNLNFIPQMHPQLQRYLAYAFSRSPRTDFLRALEEDTPAELKPEDLNRPHNVWETCVWMQVANRKLIKRADGHYRIVPAGEVSATDQVLPNELRPCKVQVQDNGRFTFELTKKKTNFWMYDRGDPKLNEIALCEAWPAWYIAFKP
jgi:hypothetical protein